MNVIDYTNISEQEVFDAVASHLIKQKVPSNIGTRCFYRTSDNLACAAGIFLTDEQAKLVDEDAFGICWSGVVKRLKLSKVHESLIVSLQQCHDTSSSHKFIYFNCLIKQLKSCAELFNLNWNFKNV